MRSPKESDLESRVAESSRLIGIPSTKLQTRSDTAWPDRAFWIPGGRPLITEFKLPGEVPREKQEYKIDILRRLDYDVLTVDDYETVMRAIRDRAAPWVEKTFGPGSGVAAFFPMEASQGPKTRR